MRSSLTVGFGVFLRESAKSESGVFIELKGGIMVGLITLESKLLSQDDSNKEIQNSKTQFKYLFMVRLQRTNTIQTMKSKCFKFLE